MQPITPGRRLFAVKKERKNKQKRKINWKERGNVVRLSLGTPLVNVLQVVERTNTSLIA